MLKERLDELYVDVTVLAERGVQGIAQLKAMEEKRAMLLGRLAVA